MVCCRYYNNYGGLRYRDKPVCRDYHGTELHVGDYVRRAIREAEPVKITEIIDNGTIQFTDPGNNADYCIDSRACVLWERSRSEPKVKVERTCEGCKSSGLYSKSVHRKCAYCDTSYSNWQPKEE